MKPLPSIEDLKYLLTNYAGNVVNAEAFIIAGLPATTEMLNTLGEFQKCWDSIEVDPEGPTLVQNARLDALLDEYANILLNSCPPEKENKIEMLTEKELMPILGEINQEFSDFCKHPSCNICPLDRINVESWDCRAIYLAQKYAQARKELAAIKRKAVEPEEYDQQSS